jgi:hypothetical protein
MMSIRTFSGTHDFHPTVLADTELGDDDGSGIADSITWNIEHGYCPRCEGPLPTMPEYPAGSRVTQCRTIPICGPCGSDEGYEQQDAATGLGYGLSGVSCWPVPTDEIDERRERYKQQMRPAILDLTGDGHLITDDGVAPIVNPRNTGGWNQYGFADEDDS